MGNKLVYADEAAKIIRKLRAADRKKLGRQLEKLRNQPDLGKNLTGPLSGLNSLRTGKYRVIYRHNPAEKTVLVLTLGHRKDIYRRTRRKRKQ